MMPKNFLHSFLIAVLFFVCISENSKVSAALPELGEEQVQRIGALIASAQEVLERAAALGVNARGAGESVMFLAAAAARHVPGMLETLSSFGINDADLVRYQLIGDASPISWFTALCRQNVLERRAFDVTKLTNGLSKAGDFVAGLGINPQVFMTQTYSLVRFLYERDCKNQYRGDAVRNLTFSYFDKLQEQDRQCCAGAIGRTFHVFTLSYIYLFDQYNADLARRPAQELTAAQALGGVVCTTVDHEAESAAQEAHAREVLAEQEAILERIRKEMQGLFVQAERERYAMFLEYTQSSPNLLVHEGGPGMSRLYLSLEEKYGADGRTANRLYNEKNKERDAAIMAARLKAEEQARIDAELKARAISDMERSLKDAEAAVFAIANGFHECRELVLRQQARKEIVINNPCEVQLRAFDLFEAKNPALKPQLDLLRREYSMRSEPDFTAHWYSAEATSASEQERLSRAYIVKKLAGV